MPEKGRRKITGFRLWSEALFAYLILCNNTGLNVHSWENLLLKECVESFII